VLHVIEPARKPGRPRLRDVAAAAGVSTATVSYVLNGTPGQSIRPQTQERVRRAADALGYVPHRVARTLREGRSRIVLLNVGDLLGSSMTSVIRGMTEELRQHGYTLLVTTDEPGFSPELTSAVAPRAALDLTVVTTGDEDDDAVSGVVAGYHAGFAYHSITQLRHLAEQGHDRVAFAAPAGARAPLARTRLDHARRAARELGLTPLVAAEVSTAAGDPHRVEAIRRLVEDDRVSAVAAYDDDVALAALTAAAELGYRVPEDLAVIGFDEGRYGHLWKPALTTVRIDAASYGRRAARLVLGMPAPEWTHPPSEVVVRESA